MKKIICAVISLIMVLGVFSGCKEQKAKRELYNVDLSEYIELGEYTNIPVDTSSKTFEEYLNELINSDVEKNNFYTETTEGVVEEGDTVNIDYVGRKDGVAFEGGTAEGYDLKIGSKKFIEGFEDGLIGVEVGSTVELNLTFPEEYGSEELAGEDVVFTVTVNTTTDNMKPEEYYSQLGYDSLEAYQEHIKQTAIENYLIDAVFANSTVIDYPEDDINTLYENSKSNYEKQIQSNYKVDFDKYLAQIGYTEQQFKNSMVENSVKPYMEIQMLVYAILDKEGIELTVEEVKQEKEKLYAEVKKNYPNVTIEQFTETYGEFYFEYIVVNQKVLDFLTENADIK